MGATFWIVRHCEREDNINPRWGTISKFRSDNSILSKRGRGQGEELAVRFKDTHIDHIFSSPFDRCLETATFIANVKNMPIKVEPGLAEALYLCCDPPGYRPLDELVKTYPIIDPSYESVMNWKLPKERMGDDACISRVKKTLKELAERYPNKSLLLVSHGAPIGAVHEILSNNWVYVGQATVSKFAVDEKGKYVKELSSDASHLSDKSNLRPW